MVAHLPPRPSPSNQITALYISWQKMTRHKLPYLYTHTKGKMVIFTASAGPHGAQPVYKNREQRDWKYFFCIVLCSLLLFSRMDVFSCLHTSFIFLLACIFAFLLLSLYSVIHWLLSLSHTHTLTTYTHTHTHIHTHSVFSCALAAHWLTFLL